MNKHKIFTIFVMLSSLFAGVSLTENQAVLFEKTIEHSGKGMVDYSLPAAFDTNYDPQMVGYWVVAGQKLQG